MTATTLQILTAYMHHYKSEDRTAALLLLILLNFHLTVCIISLLPTSPLTVLALLWAPHISSSYLIHRIVPSLCPIQNHPHPYWLPVDYQEHHSTTSNSAPSGPHHTSKHLPHLPCLARLLLQLLSRHNWRTTKHWHWHILPSHIPMKWSNTPSTST